MSFLRKAVGYTVGIPLAGLLLLGLALSLFAYWLALTIRGGE